MSSSSRHSMLHQDTALSSLTPIFIHALTTLSTGNSLTCPQAPETAYFQGFLLHLLPLLSYLSWFLLNVGEPPGWNQAYPFSSISSPWKSSVQYPRHYMPPVLIIPRFIFLIQTSLPWAPGLDFQLPVWCLHLFPPPSSQRCWSVTFQTKTLSSS